MSQTSITSAPAEAYEGKLFDRAERIMSGIASALIYFGKAVTRDLTTSVSQFPPTVDPYTTGDDLAGIAAADISIETIAGAAYGGFPQYDAVPVLRKGRIWVISEDAVDDLSKSVFVRNVAGASLPSQALGSFRATTAASFIDLGALAPVAWVGYKLIGSVHFGLLEINLND